MKKMFWRIFLILAIGGAVPVLALAQHSPPATFSGVASWYGTSFQGKRTSSGEVFDKNLFTAAHKSLPFGTYVRVVNSKTGLSVVVRINDRGPFVEGRILDLTEAAAKKIGLKKYGVATVYCRILKIGNTPQRSTTAARAQKPLPAQTARKAPVSMLAENSNYTIVLGTFRNVNNAIRLVDRLKRQGIIAASEDINGSHRVSISNVTNPQAMSQRLRDLGYRDFVILPKALTKD